MRRTKLVYMLFFAYLLLSSFAAIQPLDPTADLEESDQNVPQGTGQEYSSSNNTQQSQSPSSGNQMQTNTVQESSDVEYKDDTFDTDTWYEGESVNTETSFPKSSFSDNELTMPRPSTDWETEVYSIHRLPIAGVTTFEASHTGGGTTNEVVWEFSGRIYAGHAGQIDWQGDFSAKEDRKSVV